MIGQRIVLPIKEYGLQQRLPMREIAEYQKRYGNALYAIETAVRDMHLRMLGNLTREGYRQVHDEKSEILIAMTTDVIQDHPALPQGVIRLPDSMYAFEIDIPERPWWP